MDSWKAGLQHQFEEERNRYKKDFSPNAAATLGSASLIAYIRRHSTVQFVHVLSALLSRSADGSSSWLYNNLKNAPGQGPEYLTALCNKTLDGLPQVSNPRWASVDQSEAVQIIVISKWARDHKKEQLASQACISFALCHVIPAKLLLEQAGIPVEEMTTRLLGQNLSRATILPTTSVGMVDPSKAKLSFQEKAMSQRYGEDDPAEALKKYTVDLTELAEHNKIDPIIGRDSEIRRTIQVLCRRTKNNPVLLGEPGVGKTSIAEGIALRIVNKDVPTSLQGRLLSLDIGALNAGPLFAGEFESRLKQVMDAIEESNSDDGPGIILFIDEMHLIMGGGEKQGGKIDAANLMKPLLARGKLRCIGATTLAEYGKFVEKDAAMERRFTQVIVNEPTISETITILRGIRERYEAHHAVQIMDSALIAAAELAARYLKSRKLPDSAVDLIDECCANVKAERETRPEAVDELERKKLELKVAIHALGRAKDGNSVEKQAQAKKELAVVESKLLPLATAWEAERKINQKFTEAKRSLKQIKKDIETAERDQDYARLSDLRSKQLPAAEIELKRAESRRAASREDGSHMVEDTVTSESVAEVIGRWTGVPVSRLQSTEKDKLLSMESHLSAQVVGQPEAVSAVANAIRLSRSGLSNASKPIASLLFAGPSGTGKTLLSKTLASFMFDSSEAMIRIDGSEYSEPHAISRLIGAPPGYQGSDEGGQLTDYVRRKPFCIVLIDEIEKAAKELTTLFLQVLDDGRLTDSRGRVVDFKNTVIIMTSNVGASHLTNINPDDPVPSHVQDRVMGSMRDHFLPEFINRIDEIVVFRPLSPRNMGAIVNNRLNEVQDRLNPKNITLELDETAKLYLARVGYSSEYGARPLNRVVQKELLQPLSRLLIQEMVCEGDRCTINYDLSSNLLIVANKGLKHNKSGLVGDPPTKQSLASHRIDWSHGTA